MPSTYTTNLGIEKPATGEQAGVWGTTVNTGYDCLDDAIDGNLAIALSASGYTLVTNPGVRSEGRNKVITFTGALTQDGTITISPSTAQKIYFVRNSTTGGFALNFTQGGSGPSFKLFNGRSAMIYCNGQGSAAGVFGVLADLQCNSLLVQTNLILQGQLQSSGTVTFAAAVSLQAGATIAAPLTINLGGDAPYDIYYRSPAGPVVPLHLGSAGQVLQVSSGGALNWATVSLSIGSVITGSVANAIYFSDPSARLAQDSLISARAGVGVGIGVAPPQHSLHIGVSAPPEIWLDASNPATQQRRLVMATNGLQRLVLGTNVAAETGGNVGSNMMLYGVDDSGNNAINYIYGQRSTGNVTIGFAGDLGARLAVWGSIPSQPVMMVQGAPGQSNYLQVWENSSGTRVASIDNGGNLYLAGAGGGQNQTPWASDIDGAGHALTNVAFISGSNSSHAACLQVASGIPSTPSINNAVTIGATQSGGTGTLTFTVRLASGAVMTGIVTLS